MAAQGCGGSQGNDQGSELGDLSRVYCHGCFLDLAPSAAADGGAAEPAAGVVVRCPACRRASAVHRAALGLAPLQFAGSLWGPGSRNEPEFAECGCCLCCQQAVLAFSG